MNKLGMNARFDMARVRRVIEQRTQDAIINATYSYEG